MTDDDEVSTDEGSNVARVTISFGALLIVLGVLGYLLPEQKSPTAFIPAGFGVVFLLLGVVAERKPAARKHVMHAAVVLALLALGGAFPGLIKMIKWGMGTEPQRQAAVIAQTIMAVLSMIYIVLCVRSFIAARRNRGVEVGAAKQ